tara:strand:- start:487 stop:690 length:204 start_codon:yes stop_codon:yes gene_type:complete
MAHADEIRMCKQIAELEAHIALLRIIAEAAFHSGTCARLQPLYAIDESKCDCGLGEALTAAKAGGAM